MSSTVADQAAELHREHPWVERLTRWGWPAKGVVYTLMGFLAVTIARHEPTDEDASPEGALSIVLERPFGRVLLLAVAAGLVLYSTWRILSVVIKQGSSLHDWLERIGYGFSAVFYLLLAWAAVRAAVAGDDLDRSTMVEDLSRPLLESTFGRMLVALAGLVVVGVAAYFASTGLRRSFLDDLDLPRGEVEHRLIETSGVIGWLGRATVTFLVGLFLVVAAVQADPSDARGFDRSLREVASNGVGGWVVLLAGIGLLVYGLHCFVVARHMRLRS